MLRHYGSTWHFIWRESTLKDAIIFVKGTHTHEPRSAWKYKIRPRIIRKYGGFPYMVYWDIYEKYCPRKFYTQD